MTIVIEVHPQKAVGVKCNGIKISSIVANSQAEKLGIKLGWSLYQIHTTKVNNAKEITSELAKCRKGSTKYKLYFTSNDDQNESSHKPDNISATSFKEATPEGHKVTTLVYDSVAVSETPTEVLVKQQENEDSQQDVSVDQEATNDQADVIPNTSTNGAELVTEVSNEENSLEAASQNGSVVLKYEMYSEEFTIKDGKINASDIDEEYCLSFVMPGCNIHLSSSEPTVVSTADNKASFYLDKDPDNVFYGLRRGNTYYVYIIQDSEQEKLDQEKTKEKWGGTVTEESCQTKRKEGCSCIEGNPCVNEYTCLDWENRLTISKKNGYKL